ncbi:hypothetical protein [Schaalia suimastitidis]|uniref:hypothetical protein n=1 Tax=Schaalia suimastitidis TaxID=121163 RepID=UPI0004272A8A|nr:hypothetical protein [Schaalia suimastitidis]
MDLWSQLIGRQEPRVVVIESDHWISLPKSAAVDTAMERRARKEQWDEGQDVHLCHLLVMQSVSSGGGNSRVELHGGGRFLALLDHATAARAQAHLKTAGQLVAAVRCYARRDVDGWHLRLNI